MIALKYSFLLTFLFYESIQSDYDINKICQNQFSHISLGDDAISIFRYHQDDLTNGTIAWHCSLKILSGIIGLNNRSLFLAVKKLRLRKNVAGDCVDFFEIHTTRGLKSVKICGDYQEEYHLNKLFHIKNYLFSLFAKGTQLEVFINISDNKPIFAPLELEFVVFQYQRCDSPVLLKHYSECGDDTNICVSDDLNAYGICPLPPCFDEELCWEKDVPQSIGQRVIIGSLSTLFLLFLIFIVVLWYARTYNLFCWAPSFANRAPPSGTPLPITATAPPEVGQPNPRVIEMSERTRTASSTGEEEKDLPPAYDSLFPR